MALGGSPAILRLTLLWSRRGEAQARTMAAGKWHLPTGYPGARFPNVPPAPPDSRGFDFLRFEVNDESQQAYGDFTDERIAQAGADFVTKSRTGPFLLGLSLHNPHDICYWI